MTFLETLHSSLKFISLVISVIVFGAFIYTLLKIKQARQKSSPQTTPSVQPPPPTLDKNAIVARWNEILKHINSTRDGDWKLAVLEADKLVEYVLKKLQFEGDTLGEKLMNLDTQKLKSLEGLWEAHKIRNALAHDSTFVLRFTDAKRALELYEVALRELDAF